MTEVSKHSEIAQFLFCLTVITVWCFICSISVDCVCYGPLSELRVLFCFDLIHVPLNITGYMKVKRYFFNNRLFKLRLQHLSEFIKSFQSPLFIVIEDRKCQWCIYREMFSVLSAICIYWYASLVLLESMHLIMTKIYLWKMRVLSIVPLGCTLGI